MGAVQAVSSGAGSGMVAGCACGNPWRGYALTWWRRAMAPAHGEWRPVVRFVGFGLGAAVLQLVAWLWEYGTLAAVLTAGGVVAAALWLLAPAGGDADSAHGVASPLLWLGGFVAASLALYAVRGHYRRTYGCIEIFYAVGAVYLYLCTGSAAGLLGVPVYLAVRGLDSVYQSLPAAVSGDGVGAVTQRTLTRVWERLFLAAADRVKSGAARTA